MTNAGKFSYDAIPVPAELDAVIDGAVRRYSREKGGRSFRKWAATAAAVLAVLFGCANIAPIYAAAENIPVIGTVVKVFHIGTGGEVTDGAGIIGSAQGQTVSISFTADAQAASTAPVYTAEHYLAPNRLALTFSGVRELDFDDVKASLRAAEGVKDVYSSFIGDDSMFGFVIVLQSGYDYEITELKDPASLSLRIFKSADYKADKTVYYLRTNAVEYGEELGMLAEEFYEFNPAQLKTQSGGYIVTVGQYDTRQEAEKALAYIRSALGGGSNLYAAQATSDDIPRN